MKIGLDVNKNTVFYMLRSGQEDLTVSVAENLVRKELPDRLTEFLQAAKTKPMIRRYEFASLEGGWWCCVTDTGRALTSS